MATVSSLQDTMGIYSARRTQHSTPEDWYYAVGNQSRDAATTNETVAMGAAFFDTNLLFSDTGIVGIDTFAADSDTFPTFAEPIERSFAMDCTLYSEQEAFNPLCNSRTLDLCTHDDAVVANYDAQYSGAPQAHQSGLSARKVQPPRRQKRAAAGFRCSDCGYVCNSAGDLRKHAKWHLPESAREHGCSLCPRRFIDKRDLNRHTARVHRPVSSDAGGELMLAPKRCRLNSSSTTMLHQTAKPAAGFLHARETVQDVFLSNHGVRETSSNEQSRRAPLEAASSCRQRPVSSTAHATYTDGRQNKRAQRWLATVCELFDNWQRTLSMPLRSNVPVKDATVYQCAAVHGPIVLMSSKVLAPHLSSDFEPRSKFKLRSLGIAKQRQKFFCELEQATRTLSPTAVLKIVVISPVNRNPLIFDMSAADVVHLRSLLHLRQTGSCQSRMSRAAARRALQGHYDTEVTEVNTAALKTALYHWLRHIHQCHIRVGEVQSDPGPTRKNRGVMRPYWRRAWILQELLLPRNLHTGKGKQIWQLQQADCEHQIYQVTRV